MCFLISLCFGKIDFSTFSALLFVDTFSILWLVRISAVSDVPDNNIVYIFSILYFAAAFGDLTYFAIFCFQQVYWYYWSCCVFIGVIFLYVML